MTLLKSLKWATVYGAVTDYQCLELCVSVDGCNIDHSLSNSVFTACKYAATWRFFSATTCIARQCKRSVPSTYRTAMPVPAPIMQNGTRLVSVAYLQCVIPHWRNYNYVARSHSLFDTGWFHNGAATQGQEARLRSFKLHWLNNY